LLPTDGRKVYEANGRLMSHFRGVPQAALDKFGEMGQWRPYPVLLVDGLVQNGFNPIEAKDLIRSQTTPFH
jgi:hypothetical protein